MVEPRELPRKPQLSAKEAAEELGCSEGDVRYLLAEGKLRYGVATREIDFDASISLFDLYHLPQVANFRNIKAPSPEQACGWLSPERHLYSLWDIQRQILIGN